MTHHEFVLFHSNIALQSNRPASQPTIHPAVSRSVSQRAHTENMARLCIITALVVSALAVVINAAAMPRPMSFRVQQMAAARAAASSRSAPPSGRIVGGNEAHSGQFPYQVSIRDAIWTDFHFCGGALITSEFVLTAAHCISWDDPEDLLLGVGSHLLSNGSQYHNVSAIYAHEGFNMMTVENDIALLRIDGRVEFSRYVQPIAFDSEKYVLAGQLATVSGWGDLYVSVVRLMLLNVVPNVPNENFDHGILCLY